MPRWVPGTDASGARPHPAAWGPTRQSVRGPQPRPPSSLRERGRKRGSPGTPGTSSFSRYHVGDAQEQARSSAPLPRAALLMKPPSPRGAANPTHRVQATKPGKLSRGARSRTQRGPQILRRQAFCSPAAAQAASRGTVRLPHHLPRLEEVIICSPIPICGTPPTRDAAPKYSCAAREAAAPRTGTLRASGPLPQAPGAGPRPRGQTHPLASRAGFRPAAHPRRSPNSQGAGQGPEKSQGDRAEQGGRRRCPEHS
ncbi:hypothetical protein NDU88_008145 [Pleurodeles waltl]|uniref:Uncharacterized protein n=1 Tax=Pleurodeles waltl TaxID=8319 RepID=A0AAV7NY24_PLEWA|nr:hypothetical protein NDU88_008145 [Pleurodeles waltl]